jgi:molecular chaperone DnaK (HSP70)
MSTSPILGIDLGTTHSLVGVVDCGLPILLADEDNHRLLPSACLWTRTDNSASGAPHSTAASSSPCA